MKQLVVFIISFVLNDVIQRAVGFGYDLFSQSFDLIKTMADIGIFSICYLAVGWVVDKVYVLAGLQNADGGKLIK